MRIYPFPTLLEEVVVLVGTRQEIVSTIRQYAGGPRPPGTLSLPPLGRPLPLKSVADRGQA